MNPTVRPTSACLSILATASVAIAQHAPQPSRDCIGAEQRTSIAQAIAGRVALSQPDGSPEGGPKPPFAFYPHAGNVESDLMLSALVDLDPSVGILSFDCGHWSYDGHTGLDSEIRGFNAQAVGVPVLAALDGTVVYLHDGEPDMSTSCTGFANAITIDHGFGRFCTYGHFKTNTITVALGEFVRAGHVLGLTGSSGCSTGPHLHFEIWDDNALSFEPYAGACRPGPSGWVNQPPINPQPHVWDLSITATDPATVPSYPHPKPRDAQIAFSDPALYVNMVGLHLPPSGQYRYRFTRPDGSLAYDTGALPYPSANAFWKLTGGIYAEQWFHYQGFDFPDLHSIAGTWRVSMEIDGAPMIDAPFEVAAVRDPNFNRPPRDITAVFDPPAPTEEDVLFCRVQDSGPIYLGDPDWDLVRYRYVWTVNGNVVRDVTSAGMADAMERLSIPNGSFVTCTVIPSDGHDNGTGTPVMVWVDVTGDCNHNGIPDLTDIANGTSPDCTGNGIPDECEPDCDGNGVPDSCDLAAGTFQDCTGNGIPDNCEPDCDGSGVADSCEIAAGLSPDCDGDDVPDACEVDCNTNGVPDDCESVPVLAGFGVEFDGVDDTIALASTGLNFAGQITIEAWIRPLATDGIRIILAHGSPFTKKGSALTVIDGSYGIVGVNNGVHSVLGAIPAGDLGNWTHIAGVFDGAGWRLYHNGDLLAESPNMFGAGVGNAEWAIGSGGGGLTNFFAGGIDEVRLWRFARTQAEIQATMNTTLTGKEPGLRGYWRLDEGIGSFTGDLAPSGGASNGTLEGGAAWKLNQPCVPPDSGDR